MILSKSKVNYFVLGAFVVTAINGCAYFQAKDLVNDGTTRVKIEASERATVIAPKVQQFGSQTYVEGKVFNTGPNRIVKGYVQVDVVDAKGVRIDSQQARYSFRHFGSNKAKFAGFSAELAITPPEGSTITIQHRDNIDELNQNSGTLNLL